MLSAWLLIIIAALIVLCFSFYYQARCWESSACAREWLALEELQGAQAALRESQERIESLQLEPIVPDLPLDDLHSRVWHLRRGGKSAARIAQELEMPLSAVETLVSLRY